MTPKTQCDGWREPGRPTAGTPSLLAGGSRWGWRADSPPASWRGPVAILLILIFGFFLRFINLTQIPPGLNHDEVSLGLDAYSILKTAKDEYGKTLPLAFTAGEARPPLYVYLTIPFIAIFDLSIFSIRLLSVLASTLTVLISYLIAQKVFNQKIALLSAGLLAISPWHLRFSRMAMEATLALMFFSLAILFLLYSQKKSKLFILSSILLVFCFFTYYNYQLLAPLFFLIFFLLYENKILKDKKVLTLSLFPWVLGGVLFLWAVHFQNALFRFIRINLATTRSILSVTFEIIKNYLLIFSPKFLIIGKNLPFSENLRQKAPVFLIDYLFFLIGIVIFFILLKKQRKPGFFVLILWLFLAPIPTSLVGFPESQRNLILAPIFYMLVALGVISVSKLLAKKSKDLTKIFIVLFFSIYLFCFGCFVKYYFSKYSTDYAHFWATPWQEGQAFALENKENFQKILFTDLFDHYLRRYLVDQKINPQKVQNIIDSPHEAGGLPVKTINDFGFIQSESAQKENLKKHFFKKNLIIDFTKLFSPDDFPQAEFQNHYLKNGVWAYQSIQIL